MPQKSIRLLLVLPLKLPLWLIEVLIALREASDTVALRSCIVEGCLPRQWGLHFLILSQGSAHQKFFQKLYQLLNTAWYCRPLSLDVVFANIQSESIRGSFLEGLEIACSALNYFLGIFGELLSHHWHNQGSLTNDHRCCMTWRKFWWSGTSLHILQREREVLAQFLSFRQLLVMEFFFQIRIDGYSFNLFFVCLLQDFCKLQGLFVLKRLC